MKHIGIMGHSVEGSALCYLEACRYGSKLLGEHTHPEITLSILSMSDSMPFWRANDLKEVNKLFFKTAQNLKDAGCDFFLCPDNTAHIALEHNSAALPLPGLHISDIVSQKAHSMGLKTVGLLGTKWTMEGPTYSTSLKANRIAFETPNEKDRILVDKIIFDELCNGVFRDQSREEYLRIINTLSAKGCEAVILGCTEIPLLITPEISPLPTLDSTRLLAKAGVDVALGSMPMPSWHGGPNKRV